MIYAASFILYCVTAHHRYRSSVTPPKLHQAGLRPVSIVPGILFY